LSDSDVELVVMAASGNLQSALDICGDIRRNPALFHMPILAICEQNPDHVIEAYRHGATAAYSLPFDVDEIRARVTMCVKSHRLRGYMLNAYRVGGHPAVSDG
jgi:DNA-binding response OmpR family regulator